jgi:hypothetical protein
MYVLSIVVCPFVLFLLAIVLSVLLRYTVSDCPFGIFILFFHLYVATFQQHLHVENMPLSWSDIPELVVPTVISLKEGCG